MSSAAPVLEKAETAKMDPPENVQWVETTSLLDSSWLYEAVSAISSLERLDDNWDGYGSPRISPIALLKATQLVSGMSSDCLPVPEICPAPGGGVGIHWTLGPRELEFTIYPNGAIRFLKVLGDLRTGAEALEDGTLPGTGSTDVHPFVRWLASA
jgi:hypothetical protein